MHQGLLLLASDLDSNDDRNDNEDNDEDSKAYPSLLAGGTRGVNSLLRMLQANHNKPNIHVSQHTEYPRTTAYSNMTKCLPSLDVLLHRRSSCLNSIDLLVLLLHQYAHLRDMNESFEFNGSSLDKKTVG